MKSKDAKLFLDTWVTKVKGYCTPVVSYDDAVRSVELAEREMKKKAIETFNEAMIFYTSAACPSEEEALKYFIGVLMREKQHNNKPQTVTNNLYGFQFNGCCISNPTFQTTGKICGNCDAFCECQMTEVKHNDVACPEFDDSTLSQTNEKDYETKR